MGNLSRTNANWKIILDLLYVLPFTPIEHVVQTYETEVLGRIDEMKEEEETPFGSVAAEEKIVKLLGTWNASGWDLSLVSRAGENQCIPCYAGTTSKTA